ncbi:restriction endonuclease subunit S [uncultured Methanobrevibacter sp.]|uniref:restriction endonuclease subunit S n=1 Tax=uncultured Methanobrevibacter sp. TaxID=253161 RepID=UPI00262EE70E|nr:restriction endonuclease subunit S [uncultured Methanobrevibacter sp.]
MQQIFAQKLRFKDDNNENFDDWKERKLSKFLTEHKLKSTGKEEVYSVSVHKGLVNQVDHLGRAFSAPDTSKYNLVKPGDIVYTKSPTGDFPLGIIKQSRVDKNVIVSPLYGVFTPETYDLGYILNDYFESDVNTHNYLHPIVQKGAKNTMNITNKTFLSKSLFVPTDKEEQHKIAQCLMKFNENTTLIEMQKNQVEDFKQGLLQQMFGYLHTILNFCAKICCIKYFLKF